MAAAAKPRQLSCVPQKASAVFDPSDPSWTAGDVLHAMQAVRERLRVPFYIYDGAAVAPNFSLSEELKKVQSCIAKHDSLRVPRRWQAHGYNMGEYLFLRELESHPWRVPEAAAAAILVIPGFAGFEGERKYAGCARLVHSSVIVSAVMRTQEWLSRSRDHLVVSDFWNNWYPSWATYPRDPKRAHDNQTAPHDKPAATPSAKSRFLTRAWLETHPADLLIGENATRLYSVTYAGESRAGRGRKDQGDSADVMIAMPQADSQMRAVLPREQARIESASAEDSSMPRRLDFFFGGQTTTFIGPGRRHLGYYVRWSLMRSWAREPSAFPRTLLVETDGPMACDGNDCSQNVSHFGLGPWPALRRCDHGPGWVTVGYKTATPLYRQLSPGKDEPKDQYLQREKDHVQAWASTEPRSLGRECLSPCTSQVLAGSGGACYTTSFRVDLVMPHARFALCPRGDISMSMRTYDAVQHGAIPVLIADHIWQVGLPFQCFVPWALMSFTVNEDEVVHDASDALQRLLRKVTPAMESRMRALLAHFARDLLWRADARRVSENILLEAMRARSQPPASGGECCPLWDRTDWPRKRARKAPHR